MATVPRPFCEEILLPRPPIFEKKKCYNPKKVKKLWFENFFLFFWPKIKSQMLYNHVIVYYPCYFLKYIKLTITKKSTTQFGNFLLQDISLFLTNLALIFFQGSLANFTKKTFVTVIFGKKKKNLWKMIPKSVFTEILLCCHACSVVLHAKLGTIFVFCLFSKW